MRKQEKKGVGEGGTADLYVARGYEEEISHSGCSKGVPRERISDRFIVLKYHLSPLNLFLMATEHRSEMEALERKHRRFRELQTMIAI
jgi:hypothetical protein